MFCVTHVVPTVQSYPVDTLLPKGSTILCPMSEIVCFLVLIFTYSHVENSLFFALDLAVSL